MVVDIRVVTRTQSECAMNVPGIAKYNNAHQSTVCIFQSVNGIKNKNTIKAKKN